MKYCIIGSCKNKYHARGYCAVHYSRLYSKGLIKSIITKKGGTKKHPLYNTYTSMISRCNSKKQPNYGGRGITVCKRWSGVNGFVNFVDDMGDKPKNTSIDRINVNGNYSPENCRWAGKYTQAGNTRNNNNTPGVGWHKQRRKWRARIKVNGKDISLGLYKKYNDAKKPEGMRNV